MFQDPDCEKLVPSSKLEIDTYITDKIKVIGSCILFAVHPDTQCLQEVTLYVTSQEGSVVLSCATTLTLNLIQPHTSLNHSSQRSQPYFPVIADHPMKNESQLNVHVLSRKSEVFTESTYKSMRPMLNASKNQISTMCSNKEQFPAMCSRKEQSPAMCSKLLTSHTYHVGQCVKYHVNTRKWWYPATITSLCSEKGSYMIRVISGAVYKEKQANLNPHQFQDKNCQLYPV